MRGEQAGVTGEFFTPSHKHDGQPGPMVLVEWVDPGGINGWHEPDKLPSVWDEITGVPVRSLGFLQEDSERGVCIVSGYAKGGAMYIDTTVIPRSNVRAVHRLRRGK